ncbi:MAG: hypothetical protein AVDCRST_MAG64-232 [uncultured Phycisphaerae bacterium]|uniref:Uncharacterized protein n=1 Tax=uncultured Phycisphaerae bacterium TaxID=904963 RepID=A0A6J4N4U6_9BACT|nr:MAG: hypothetical protein AVDCRST_MAG64-232 [uncultured Phycisphaerae bacterium]
MSRSTAFSGGKPPNQSTQSAPEKLCSIHFVILRYPEGSLVPRTNCLRDERSFGVPQDDKLNARRLIFRL